MGQPGAGVAGRVGALTGGMLGLGPGVDIGWDGVDGGAGGGDVRADPVTAGRAGDGCRAQLGRDEPDVPGQGGPGAERGAAAAGVGQEGGVAELRCGPVETVQVETVKPVVVEVGG